MVLSLGFTLNECVKDRSQAVKSAAAFQVCNLAFYIHLTVAPLYCHTCDPGGFHIEKPFAPYNRAMLDAHFLCGQLSFLSSMVITDWSTIFSMH